MAENSKTVNRVRGVLFSKADFITMEAWRDAGYPDNVTVRDTPYWLRISNIPIVDAVEINGRYVRAPAKEHEKALEAKIKVKPKRFRKVKLSKTVICHTKLKYEEWPQLLPTIHNKVTS